MSTFTKFRDSTVGLIGALAPSLATALGGPIAGMAVKTLSNTLLGHDKGTEQEIEEALSKASPETLAAIKKADQDFEVKMKELDIDVDKISADDRNSARDREIKTGDKTPARLAIFVTSGFFGILIYLMKYGVPAQGGEALLIMLGSLGTAWTGIIAYYFGSSAGSKAKNEMITKLNGVK